MQQTKHRSTLLETADRLTMFQPSLLNDLAGPIFLTIGDNISAEEAIAQIKRDLLEKA